MSRIARVVAVGLPHHITQRGNYQQAVFHEEADRRQYLWWIRNYSIKYGLSILAYCLMQNHVHFIAIPSKLDSLAKTFNAAHMCYSQYVNEKLKQKGHLWQGRFYSCVLDESHLILAARYIERNPVRAGIIEKPWQWFWSSAIEHIDRKAMGIIKLGNLLEIIGMSHSSWKEYIDKQEEEGLLQHIRKYTIKGCPLGTSAFVEKLELETGRRLRALPVGRPKKEEK